MLASNQKSIIVPFLVTKEIIDLPIVGFNVIEEFIKTDVFESDLNRLFSLVPSDNIFVLTDLVKRNNEAEFCCLTTGKKDRLIKKGQSFQVSSRLNHGPVEIATPVLSEPDELVNLPSGISVNDTVIEWVPDPLRGSPKRHVT